MIELTATHTEPTLDQRLAAARALRAAGEIADALALVAEIVASHPDHVSALRLQGQLARRDGNAELAITSFSRALQQAPEAKELLLELGDALVAGHRPAEAVAVFEQSLALRPRDAAVLRGLGQAQLDLGRSSEALESFRKALAILPYDQYAAHMIAALSGESSRPAAGYVAELFDSYASTFDTHLTGTLHYDLPQLLRSKLTPLLGTAPVGDMLDLGCGTGLAGVALRDLVSSIDGIDISPKMLAKAAERSIYRHLRTGDATTLLGTDPSFAGPYDLVTAADVFIYFATLEPIFAAVAQALSAGGLFAFSVETEPGEKIVLRSSGRFAHPAHHVETLAARFGFAIIEQHGFAVRHERNQPIAGTLYVLRKVFAASPLEIAGNVD